ncbi:MAG: radical SAM protein [Deltaproteobacteria bacterium]|nr:radical SAM protein [Deltaproteobacteria bacterium]
MKTKLHGSIIVTYRCNAKCNMCNVWHHPSDRQEEVGLETFEKLPEMFFANVTGGEPFIRKDLPDIIEILRRKSRRIVLSSNGYFTQRIISLFQKYPDLGIRISVEGLPKTNDTIRGIPEGFDRTLRTLLILREMGIKDIGFAMTLQDINAPDLPYLYHLAKALGYEFATATLHNSHYFHKLDNRIGKVDAVAEQIQKLIQLMLKSKKPKEWFRAYYNYGLIHYIHGNARLLPCEMGEDGFFLDPFGDILACNGMNDKLPMGNLKHQAWEDIWNSQQAASVRQAVRTCPKNCWMIGSVAPAIWHHPLQPMKWVAVNKLRSAFGKAPLVAVEPVRPCDPVPGHP